MANYAHHITTGTPGFSNLPTALSSELKIDSWIETTYLSQINRGVVPWGTRGARQILAEHLTLSQPGGSDYANHITTGTSRFSDLSTALLWQLNKYLEKHTGA